MIEAFIMVEQCNLQWCTILFTMVYRYEYFIIIVHLVIMETKHEVWTSHIDMGTSSSLSLWCYRD